MKKAGKHFFSGIRGKLFILILITVAVLAASFFATMAYRDRMLAQLASETGKKQVSSITELTEDVMTQETRDKLTRITELEAETTDDLFTDAHSRVTLLAEYTAEVYRYEESYTLDDYAFPDPSLDGQLVVQVIPAPGVDTESGEFKYAASLASNISEFMVSLCTIFDTENVFVALPEGAFLSASRSSASWFTDDGKLLEYDARGRFWYKQAVEAGDLVFTDVEVDANTGALSLVCAKPVYGPDGRLRAVVGTDLFLNTMQMAIQGSERDGGYHLVVNSEGHVIVSSVPDEEFTAKSSADAMDLRRSKNKELAAFITDALQGQTEVRLIQLENDAYYMIGVPVETVGWSMISVYGKDKVTGPATMLRENYEQIEGEAVAGYRDRNRQSAVTLVLILVAMLVLLSAIALMQGQKIVRPLNTMTKRIGEQQEDHLDFRMEDAYRTGDEIEILADSFAKLSSKTNEYVEQVKNVTAEKERISADLRMAATIQASMLPHVFPPFPDRKEFDLYASMDPAKEVGGDFYDFFFIDNDHLALVIADVSGKGVPAALFMMNSKVVLQTCAMPGRPVNEILEKTNEAICGNNQPEMFVTVWLGILEISTGKLSAANAGHEYPALKRADGSFELLKDKHGFVIGGMAGVKYKPYELQLNPGDKLFVYTDGVPEATDAEQELFGTDRMIDALNEAKDAAPTEVLRSVRKAVDGFVKDAEQFDDLTMLCMSYYGPDGNKPETQHTETAEA